MGEYLELHLLKKDNYKKFVDDMKTFLGSPLYCDRPRISNYEEDSITLTKYDSRPLAELETQPDVVFDWCFKTFNTKDVIVEYVENFKEEIQNLFNSQDRENYEVLVDYLNSFNKVEVKKDKYGETLIDLKILSKLEEFSDKLKCLDDIFLLSDVRTVGELEELLKREDIDDLRFVFTYN